MAVPIQGAALLLAALGCALLMSGSYELSPRYLRGDLLALLAGLLYAGYLIIVERARGTLEPLPLLLLASLFGAVMLLPFAIGLGEQVWPSDWTAGPAARARQPGDRAGAVGLCARHDSAARRRACPC